MVLTDAEVLEVLRKSCEAPRPEHFTDRGHCCECAEHDDVLRSRNLDSLTVGDVGNPGWDPICFVTDQAFFYYFPALARLALDPPSRGHGWYFEQLLFHLAYQGASNRRMLVAASRHKEAVLLLLRHVQDTRAALVEEYGCQQELEQALAIWSQ
jgi:hypothetical protein